jgi:O-antigen/teichoic acid export membrane protein
MKGLLSNPIFFVIARYGIYALQLANAVWIGIELGPLAFASWAFIQLVLQYAAQLNFGIPYYLTNSLAVHGTHTLLGGYLINASFRLISAVALLFVAFFLLEHFWGIFAFQRYISLTGLILMIFIVIIQQYNQLWMSVARIENRFKSIVLSQFIPQVIISFFLLFFRGQCSPELMVTGLLLGHVFTMVTIGKVFSKQHENSAKIPQSVIIRESLKLFIYNAFFYLMLINTRAEISYVLSESAFGLFSFAFVFINVLILGMDALGFIWFPQLVRMYSVFSPEHWQEILQRSQRLFLSLAMIGIVLLVMTYPCVHVLTDKYSGSSEFFYSGIFPLSFYFLSFSLPSMLMAQSKNHWIAWVSFGAFLLNFTMVKCILHYVDDSARFALLVTGLVYFFQYLVLLLLVKKMIKKRFPDLRVKLFYWKTQGVFLFFMILLMISVSENGQIRPITYLTLLVALGFQLFNWKVCRDDMRWIAASGGQGKDE